MFFVDSKSKRKRRKMAKTNTKKKIKTKAKTKVKAEKTIDSLLNDSKDSTKVFPNCPIETLLMLLDGKWKVFIVRDLLGGKKRFGELKKATGASQKSLTTNLREMEEDGLIERKVYAQIPPKVEYSLTDIGYSLAPVLDAMAGWGLDYKEYCELKNKLKENKGLD